ncbi:MAG TPA: hypothetical protein VNG53_02110, partial [Bacteroidia bacterium]|nr:hypothetical protein [Bacteroidia bacterium]
MLLEEGVILRKKSKNSYKYSLGIYAPPKSNGDHLITISNGDHLITQVKKQRIRKETNINNINIINTEKSVLLKNLDENVKLKKTFG